MTATHNMASNGTNGASTNGYGYTVPLLINGREVRTEKIFEVTSPATGKVIHKAYSASVKDASGAVALAQKAFPAWRDLPPPVKRDIFLNAANVLERRAEELGGYMMSETGADEFWATKFNVPLAADILRDIAGRISSIQGTMPITNDPNTSALVFKEPYGVILGIAPWNAPYILGFRSVAYAMAAGNTAIFKGPEFAPRTAWAIGSVFKEAGLPDGVLNVIIHDRKDAAAVTYALIENPLIKKINFTGSTIVGRLIAERAGKYLKPVLLELGGKAPAIVMKDADLELAAMACAKGAFLHSGQICMSTERVIVHRDVEEAFAKHFQAAAHRMFPEHSSAPVLINADPVAKNRKLLEDGIAKGANLLVGELPSQGTSMRPVILQNVKPDMDIYHIETFGPSVSMITFDTEEEAIQIANDSDYGLTSAVFTKDLLTGLRIAKQIETGAVHINDMTVHDETALPHGGMKNSGFGRFGAVGLEEWVRSKTVTFKN